MNKSVNSSLRPNPAGDWPQVDPTACIDPTAQIIGNVHIGPDVFVGPYAVIRADETDTEGRVHPVTIEAQCNIQDGVIIHALGGTSVTIGRRSSVSHGCTIHGPCTIGQGCFIGFKSVVYDAVLHDRIFVGTAAVVQSVTLQSDCSVRPATVLISNAAVEAMTGPLGSQEIQFMARVINANLKLIKGYHHKPVNSGRKPAGEWKPAPGRASVISVK